MSFVFDGSTLPAGKSDFRPLSVPPNKGYTAAEWNQVMAAVSDVRAASLGAFGAFSLGTGNSWLGERTPDEWVAETQDGEVGGVTIADRGQGRFVVSGSDTLASLSSGVNQGTAGSGTTTTVLQKPTGAPNWPTSGSGLKGLFLRITGGGGFRSDRLNLRPIRSNTASALTVDTVDGMNSTTTFQIVTLTSEVTDETGFGRILAARCRPPVVIVGVSFADAGLARLVEASDCLDVTLSGCVLNATSSLFERCSKLRFEHCVVTQGSFVDISKCVDVSIRDIVSMGGGRVRVSDCDTVDARRILATDAPSNVFQAQRCRSVSLEVSATNGAATPVVLEDVQRVTSVDAHLTGSGNAGFGVELVGQGAAALGGSSLTGASGNVSVNGGGAVAWSSFASPVSWRLPQVS